MSNRKSNVYYPDDQVRKLNRMPIFSTVYYASPCFFSSLNLTMSRSTRRSPK